MIATRFRTLTLALSARRRLAYENRALRHQIAVLQRSVKRPQLKKSDRLLRVVPSINRVPLDDTSTSTSEKRLEND